MHLRGGLALSAAGAALIGMVQPSVAQVVPPENSFTDTYIRLQTITTTTNTVNVSNFVTRLIGRLNTGQVVLDQSYSEAFGSVLVQNALTGVRAAIAAAGGPAVVILSPVRTASASSSSSSSTSVDQLTGSTQTPYTQVLFGPGTVITGDRGICTTAGSISGPLNLYTPPTGCTLPGTIYEVGDDETNFNTHVVTNEAITRTTTVTTTTTLNETYELVGIVTPVGGVHGALVREAGLAGERFLKRLVTGPDGYPDVPEGDGEGLFNRVWLEAYGAWGSLDGSGDLSPGYDADVWGVSAGLGREVSDGLTVSLGLDVSWAETEMALPGDFPETGDSDLTQVGLALHRDWGRAEAGFAFTYGWGSFETASGSEGLDGVSISKTDAELWGVEGRIGVAAALGGGTLTPHAGFTWVNVDFDAVAGSGSAFDLFVSGDTQTSFQLYAGIDYAETFVAGQGDLTLKLSARVLQELGDGTVRLTAAFEGGGSLPLVLAEDGRTAGEVAVGLSYAFGDSVSVHGGYEGRFSEGSDIHSAKAGVTVRF
ncbi:MAG: autotransporter outer membrane beta-barrel domain-containing protein [Micropepsaceae bacterium]